MADIDPNGERERAAVSEHPCLPARLVKRVGSICERLAGAVEHDAWTGTSWRVGGTTFAHIVQIAGGWPAAYARAAGSDGPSTVVTFQADDLERAALAARSAPYFLPPWRPGIVGLVLDDATDWTEVAELITDSHRLCSAPRRRH